MTVLRLPALIRALACGLTAPILLLSPAAAQDFPAPSGEVILTLSGDIGRTNAEGTLVLDQALLDTLTQHEFATSTIWTEGVITFRGVLLRDLLAASDAQGSTLTLTALNDYSVSMPAADATADGPLVAYRMNGAPMPVRDKGPVWLLYPYDTHPEFRSELTYARSIWQLAHIEVGD